MVKELEARVYTGVCVWVCGWHQEDRTLKTNLTQLWHNSFIFVTWLSHTCNFTHLRVLKIWLIHMSDMIPSHVCDMTHTCVWHDSFTCVWHDSFICATWRTRTCYTTHPYLQHYSFICATWLTYMCVTWHELSAERNTWHEWDMTHMYNMTHSYVHHDSLISATWLTHLCDRARVEHGEKWVRDSLTRETWLIYTCDMTHSYMWQGTCRARREMSSQRTQSLPRMPQPLWCRYKFPKEPYIWCKTALRIMQRALYIMQKRPVYEKEPCMMNSAIYLQNSHIYHAKEAYVW